MAMGSSPLVRGAHESPCVHLQARGIIPARAGSTLRSARARKSLTGIIPARAGSTVASLDPCLGKEDHPRSCGEHLPAQVKLLSVMGSSPLVRGARIPGLYRLRKGRIIPARAGSTQLQG